MAASPLRRDRNDIYRRFDVTSMRSTAVCDHTDKRSMGIARSFLNGMGMATLTLRARHGLQDSCGRLFFSRGGGGGGGGGGTWVGWEVDSSWRSTSLPLILSMLEKS